MLENFIQVKKIKEMGNALKHYKWDRKGVAEVHLTWFGKVVTHEGYKIWYSCEESTHHNGIGFLVRRQNEGNQ